MTPPTPFAFYVPLSALRGLYAPQLSELKVLGADILVQVGFVRSEKRGRWVYYALLPAAFEALRATLAPFATAPVEGDEVAREA